MYFYLLTNKYFIIIIIIIIIIRTLRKEGYKTFSIVTHYLSTPRPSPILYLYKRFHLRSAVTSSEARLDIKAGGFWARGVTAFFDVRVTHVNSKCYQSKPTSEVFKEQEEEKKRKYQQWVLDVEMGSFTPLVFGTNGGMGNECQRLLKHLADKIAQKDTPLYGLQV